MIQIVSVSQKPPSKSPCAIAIGAFDGIHVGHRELIRRTVEQAEAAGLVPAVFTFAPSSDFKMGERLCPREESFRMMEELGIRLIYEADFASIRSLSPSDFVGQVLVGVCDARVALCGFNFRFGKGASADGDALCRLMREQEREGCVIPAISVADAPVSSSRVRAALREGDMPLAGALLGRPFALRGSVSHGSALGRSLGFPTLNLPVPSGIAVPKQGVYVSETKIGDRVYRSVTDVGTRPTVSSLGEIRWETHVLDELGDLYGREVSVSLLSYLREERRFSDREALAAQIRLDAEAARGYISCSHN